MIVFCLSWKKLIFEIRPFNPRPGICTEELFVCLFVCFVLFFFCVSISHLGSYNRFYKFIHASLQKCGKWKKQEVSSEKCDGRLNNKNKSQEFVCDYFRQHYHIADCGLKGRISNSTFFRRDKKLSFSISSSVRNADLYLTVTPLFEWFVGWYFKR